jgi:hypothetical protein
MLEYLLLTRNLFDKPSLQLATIGISQFQPEPSQA